MHVSISTILLLTSIADGALHMRKFSSEAVVEDMLGNHLPGVKTELNIKNFHYNDLDENSPSNKMMLLPQIKVYDQSRGVSKMLKLVAYFFLWYFFTVVYNVSNKRVLNDLPLPATVAVLQIIIGIPVFLPLWILKRPNFDACWSLLPSLCRISFLHALGNLATVYSLSQGSVSFTHIIKAAEPIFSAALSAIVFGDISPTSVYLTLIPIVLGVGLASTKELSFTWTGFLCGMASNLFYQLRIVLSKKELTSDRNALTPANFFRVLTIISAIELLPISVALEGYKVRSLWESAISAGVDMDMLFSNILISGFSYHCYNEIAFWILGAISPMTHAVGNTIKRVVIILASIMILKSSISVQGIVGSSIAVLGTFAYSLAVHHAALQETRKISN